MFNPSELQEHLNFLDESLIESASLESDLVTKLSSELSELTNPLFSAALESKLSAPIDSAENEDRDRDLGTSSSTNILSLKLNSLSTGSEDSYRPIATVSDQKSDIFNISVPGQNAGDKLLLDLGQSFGSTGSELSVSQNSPSQHYGSSDNLNASSSYASAASQIPFAPADNVGLSGDYRINALLSGTRWYANTISYSFFDNGSSNNYSNTRVGEVSDVVKNNVRYILEKYVEPLINVNFVEVIDGGNSYGQLRYSLAEDVGNVNPNIPAHAYTPGDYQINGDVHLNPNFDRPSTNGLQGGLGTFGFYTLMHESLHALGLKHSGPYDSGNNIPQGPFLPEDSTAYTVMSYKFGNPPFYPSTLRSYDVMALQYLYGARSSSAGNTTSISDTVSMSADGSQSSGGGHDTLIGESGNDPLVGYASSTENDVLTGGTGTDTFVLGNSSSAFYQGDDYAKITDFDFRDDHIQVKGTSSQYFLQSGNWFGNSALDTAISFGNDVIGVVQDSTNVNLTRDFVFA